CYLLLTPLTAPPSKSPPFPYTTLFRSWNCTPNSPRSVSSNAATGAPELDARTVNSGGASVTSSPCDIQTWRSFGWPRNSRPSARSEEHTSELQSRENLVCRLLLEKKKN